MIIFTLLLILCIIWRQEKVDTELDNVFSLPVLMMCWVLQGSVVTVDCLRLFHCYIGLYHGDTTPYMLPTLRHAILNTRRQLLNASNVYPYTTYEFGILVLDAFLSHFQVTKILDVNFFIFLNPSLASNLMLMPAKYNSVNYDSQSCIWIWSLSGKIHNNHYAW